MAVSGGWRLPLFLILPLIELEIANKSGRLTIQESWANNISWHQGMLSFTGCASLVYLILVCVRPLNSFFAFPDDREPAFS
ncbi:hypothetical protein LguiB_016481 [Lonicera macranthoides]